MVDWKEWRSLGGVFASGPGAVINGDGLLETFGRGADKAIWHKKQVPTAHDPLEAHTHAPTRTDTTLTHTTHAQVVADGMLTWSAWNSLRGITSTGPGVRVRPDGMVDMFARGVDKQIWYKGQSLQSVNNTASAVFGVWKTMDGSVLSEAFAC